MHPMHLVHGHILIDAYPMGQWVEYKCNKESMLLKDGANQAKICKAWIRLLTIGGTSINMPSCEPHA